MALGVWLSTLALMMALALLPGRAARLAEMVARRAGVRAALEPSLGAGAVDLALVIVSASACLMIAGAWPGVFQLVKLAAAALALAALWRAVLPPREPALSEPPATRLVAAGARARIGEPLAVMMLVGLGPLAIDVERPGFTQLIGLGAATLMGAAISAWLALRMRPSGNAMARLIRATERPAAITMALAMIYALVATWGR